KRVFKSDHARALARALLAADEYAFTGYARWQINDRWDVFAGNESLKPYQAEERFFRRLCQPSMGWPKALAASLAFRLYLAQRDAFVRAAARTVFKLRRIIAQDHSSQGSTSRRGETAATYLEQLKTTAAEFTQALHAGRTAAHAMWARTRSPQLCGPNEKMLQTDAHRLKAWREWLKAAGRNPAIIAEGTPVCGAWQLQFMVHNFAPAGQKIVVEQLGPDGLWRELASRFTIEFRAQTARPRSKCKREFTVPLTTSRPSLRIALRGIGAVAISHITVTDGVVIQRRRDFSRKKILGGPITRRGFPDFNILINQAVLPINLP
ncbi:MAG: glycoside hydrolase family 20, partial [Opitutaceae bacterium]